MNWVSQKKTTLSTDKDKPGLSEETYIICARRQGRLIWKTVFIWCADNPTLSTRAGNMGFLR